MNRSSSVRQLAAALLTAGVMACGAADNTDIASSGQAAGASQPGTGDGLTADTAADSAAASDMRKGMEHGYVQPRALMTKTLPQLATHVVESAEDSLFWQPVTAMPDSIEASEQERVKAACRGAITDKLVPAYQSSMAESDVVAEVERYIAIPGQALACKIGQRAISEMRRRAEETQGDTFDIRAFHRQVLIDGALPMEVLSSKIDEWLESS